MSEATCESGAKPAFAPWAAQPDMLLDRLRLLVVAESHYREEGCAEPFTPDETNEIVRNNAPGFGSSRRDSLFNKIADLLSTDSVPSEEVWSRISYYNYFQRPMDFKRERPKARDYADGVAPFDFVLRQLRPDAVLVMSSRLWNGMRNDSEYVADCALGRIYDLLPGECFRIPAAHTHHPASTRPRFDPEAWREPVRTFLTYVRARKAP